MKVVADSHSWQQWQAMSLLPDARRLNLSVIACLKG